jgi:predicted flavoprotein YhiN
VETEVLVVGAGPVGLMAAIDVDRLLDHVRLTMRLESP